LYDRREQVTGHGDRGLEYARRAPHARAAGRVGEGGAGLPSRAPAGRWRIWYDDQCEVCQAGLAWLRWLDAGRDRVEAVALSTLAAGDPASRPPGAGDEDLLRHLHALAPDGTVHVGADAVARLARLFPLTAGIGWLTRLPGVRALADAAYGWVARHRYSLSRCRGGACGTARVDLVRERASWRAFQACRALGWTAIAPLGAALHARRLGRQLSTWWTTRGRTATLLSGRLSIHVLGGGCSALVPILFGELFTMVGYRSLLVDPGGSRMRRSVRRALTRASRDEPITHVVPTHAHEEHAGNLDLAVQATGARLRAHRRALPLLARPPRIPRMRALVIGQPPPVRSPIEPLGPTLALRPDSADVVEVVETPGHSPEHVSLYVPRERLLLVGDGFMGTHFSSPNDDVDHRAWIASLERLLALDIDIMVEAHGHVHTLREDVLADLARQGLGALASRQAPRALIAAKLGFLRWVGEQIEQGRQEGLPAGGIRATIFPWTQRWSYESALHDATAAAVSGREFGRHKLVRSFHPPAAPGQLLPVVYEVRWRG
jgi:glyoxylase-like metal-dependent hydrolase (beta-lactamase superfamily II)/predicted DCC family thiol-disulfide oxidoreductase YuxK